MSFTKAIKELLGKYPDAEDAIIEGVEKWADALGLDIMEREPAAAERKIDHPWLRGWKKDDSGYIRGSEGHAIEGSNGERREFRSDLILHSPDTMSDLIDLVNKFDKDVEGNALGYFPYWLHTAMNKLRTRVIDSGFSDDLQ